MAKASSNAYTPENVAAWMLSELNRANYLFQETAVHGIATRFGREFTNTNTNGGESIDRRILQAFRRLSGDSVVWERAEKCWRRREKWDAPGRMQG
jgi:hypothetical protein